MTSTPSAESRGAVTAVAEGELLWNPPASFAETSRVARYIDWLRESGRADVSDYDALWQWSVTEIEAFWASIWDYFEIDSDTPYTQVLDRRVMPGARWFEGSRVNYAEHLLRNEAMNPDGTVFHHLSETRPLAQMNWRELGRQVRVLATQLRARA